MEVLNYFTGKFSESELKNHFDSLDENKLKSELEIFINQYLYSMKIKEQTRKLAKGCTRVRKGEADVV